MIDIKELLELPLPSGLYASADLNKEYRLEMFGRTINRYDGSVTPGWLQIIGNKEKLIAKFDYIPEEDFLDRFGGIKKFKNALVCITKRIEISLNKRDLRLKNKIGEVNYLREKILNLTK